MFTRLLLFAVFSGAAFAGCLPVTGNHIAGRDLALADPQFAALPSSLTVGVAPAPGSSRIYAAAELQRICRANGISAKVEHDICFEIPMVRVREEEVADAMRRSLPAGAELKIVEMAKFEMPAGQLEFPIDAMEPPGIDTAGVRLWRGYVKYADMRKAPYWARVTVAVHRTVVVANKDLAVNTPISEGSVRIESQTGAFARENLATRIEDVRGRAPSRALKAGSVIPLAILLDPPTVRRGDPVTVEVQSGHARLVLDAVAEAPGREGQIVELRNPSTGKTFKARLNAGSTAVVVIAQGQRL
jgi:flagellar basal body P-ring formation protein FlgA